MEIEWDGEGCISIRMADLQWNAACGAITLE